MKLLVVVSFFFFVSCQVKPTTAVSEAGVRLEKQKFSGLVSPETVVFDTRSTFDFNLNHVPGSLNLAPEDFVVDRDPMDAARRLSLYGVEVKTPVLVIGIDQGKVQDLAWQITRLGVENVETVSLSAFKAVVSQAQPVRKNTAIWTPSMQFGILNQKQFQEHLSQQMRNSKDGLFPMSRAREKALQNPALGQALVKKVLVLTTAKINPAGFDRVTVREFPMGQYFDSDYFLVKKISLDVQLASFDAVYLLDQSKDSKGKAMVLKASGAKSIWIVR
jgi:hypothetical protein